MVRGLVKSSVKRFGYEILGPKSAYAAQRSLAGLLRQESINLVLDVGANTGQFAGELRATGYKGQILSFEPLEAAHAQLSKQAESDPHWRIAIRTALGAETGIAEIHVSANSASSSILDMLPRHFKAEPLSGYVGKETVTVNRLDDVCAVSSSDRVFLKVDVQGYESKVLEGAHHILQGCRAVLVEMSLVPLYEGQVLVRDLWDILAAQGFEPWSLEPGFRHPATGRLLQLDGVFVRAQQNTEA